MNNLHSDLVAGFISAQSNDAKQWAANVTTLLKSFVDNDGNTPFQQHIDLVADWLAQGAGKSISGVAYKKRHNEAVFPPEQVFCNQKTKAKRPLPVVASAVATALCSETLYNPNRFKAGFTANDFSQGLQSFSRKYTHKAELSQELSAIHMLTTKTPGKTASLANELLEARLTGNRQAATELAVKLVRAAPKTVPVKSTVKLID